MKVCSRLFFLVLAVVPPSVRGHPDQAAAAENYLNHTTDWTQTSTTEGQSEAPPPTLTPRPGQPEAPTPTLTPPPQTLTPATQTGSLQVSTTQNETSDDVISSASPATSQAAVSKATGSTSKAELDGQKASPWGYVFLALIMLVIFGLCLILSLLRRASRTYSFDLQRPTPVDRSGKPDGTFESIYLDDLDQLSPDYLAHPPLTNGMSTEPQGWDFDGENGTTTHPQDQGGIMESGGRSLSQFSVAEITSAAFKQEIIHHPPLYHDDAHPSCPSSLSAEEQPTPNGMETSATSKSYPDPACETSPQLSGAEHLNENNNNLSVCSGDPFVEISLNDPTWCRQLLQPTEAPSSFSSSSPQHLY